MTIINSGNIKKIVYGGVEYPVASGGDSDGGNIATFSMSGTSTLLGLDIDLVVPDGVTSINGLKSSNIRSIEIPNGLTSFRADALRDNKLTSLSLPISVTSIQDNAFAYNQLTGTINIGSRLSTLGQGAFRDNNYTSLDWSNSSISTIPADCFRNNNLSGEITIPASVQTIGPRAFRNNNIFRIFISRTTRYTSGSISGDNTFDSGVDIRKR